jgi:hypothetical protein
MKIKLTKPQYEVSSCDKRFRVLISGRRFGKTYLCITEMMKYASKPNQQIWYVAPTFKMAKEICWSNLKEMLNQFNWIDDINETTLTIRIRKTNSTISLKGAENYDSLRGTGLNFLILDEFADIDKRTWFEVLRASVADTLGDVLMCGTPKGYGNWSYEMYLKGKQDDQWSSFQYTTIQGGMVSKEEIEQAKQDIDIRTFRQEFEGTFPGSKAQIFIYPDPASRQRKTSAGGRTDLSILQNAGFKVKVKHKHPSVRDRVNAVNSKLKDSKGKRYIFVSKSCKTMIKGLQRQIYKENTNIPDKEQGFDHMNDALGYLIDYIKPLTSNVQFSKPTRWAIK